MRGTGSLPLPRLHVPSDAPAPCSSQGSRVGIIHDRLGQRRSDRAGRHDIHADAPAGDAWIGSCRASTGADEPLAARIEQISGLPMAAADRTDEHN